MSARGLAASEAAVPTPGDHEAHVTTENMQFSTARIEVEAGEIAVFVQNEDPVLRTFTIDDLGVDFQVRPEPRAVVFDAPAGAYEFVCTPHANEMMGVLIVANN